MLAWRRIAWLSRRRPLLRRTTPCRAAVAGGGSSWGGAGHPLLWLVVLRQLRLLVLGRRQFRRVLDLRVGRRAPAPARRNRHRAGLRRRRRLLRRGLLPGLFPLVPVVLPASYATGGPTAPTAGTAVLGLLGRWRRRRAYPTRSAEPARSACSWIPSEARVYVDGYYAGTVDDFDGLFQRLNVSPGRTRSRSSSRATRRHRVKRVRGRPRAR